jgi:hypothetical protein
MSTAYFLDLARQGLRAALATDLFLHEEPDPDQARCDGMRLGRVIERAARRWQSPLAMPLMDLRLEKADLLGRLDIPEEEVDRFQWAGPLAEEMRVALRSGGTPPCHGSEARDRALRYITEETDLFPIGMVIGPFSLMTKLMTDPITAVALAGCGLSPEDEPQVRLLLDCHEAAEDVVLRSVRSQLEHGARAILVCEPAANTAYLSPRQMRAGSPLFERLVLEPNARLKAALDGAGADMIFHDCGELTDAMVTAFAHRLRPAVLSLGSSRALWEDAALVPEDVVLFGNMPSKSFYSDTVMPVEEVQRRATELVQTMRRCGHAHILATECDVLFVPQAGETIWRKVETMMSPEAVP